MRKERKLLKTKYDGPAVYMIYNAIDNKLYIGSTMHFQNRLMQHQLLLDKRKHPIKELQKDYDDKKINGMKILQELNGKSELFVRTVEKLYMMEALNNNHKLYNKSPHPDVESIRTSICFILAMNYGVVSGMKDINKLLRNEKRKIKNK